MRYVSSKYQKMMKEETYRIYMSDSLFYLGQDKRLTVRYQDIADKQKKETRNGDEIALDIIKRLDLKVE